MSLIHANELMLSTIFMARWRPSLGMSRLWKRVPGTTVRMRCAFIAPKPSKPSMPECLLSLRIMRIATFVNVSLWETLNRSISADLAVVSTNGDSATHKSFIGNRAFNQCDAGRLALSMRSYGQYLQPEQLSVAPVGTPRQWCGLYNIADAHLLIRNISSWQLWPSVKPISHLAQVLVSYVRSLYTHAMSYDTILLFLLTALFSPIFSALSIDQPSTLDQFNISTLDLAQNGNLSLLLPKVANLSGSYRCIPSSKYLPWTKRPTLRDCGGAIRRLPSSGDINIFKRKNRANPLYDIPKESTVGSCKVTVNLTEHASTAWSSWVEIGLAATEASLACIKGDYTGGSTTCGEQDKLNVTLAWVKNSDPDGLYSANGLNLPDLDVHNASTGKGTEWWAVEDRRIQNWRFNKGSCASNY